MLFFPNFISFVVLDSSPPATRAFFSYDYTYLIFSDSGKALSPDTHMPSLFLYVDYSPNDMFSDNGTFFLLPSFVLQLSIFHNLGIFSFLTFNSKVSNRRTAILPFVYSCGSKLRNESWHLILFNRYLLNKWMKCNGIQILVLYYEWENLKRFSLTLSILPIPKFWSHFYFQLLKNLRQSMASYWKVMGFTLLVLKKNFF